MQDKITLFNKTRQSNTGCIFSVEKNKKNSLQIYFFNP